MLGEPNAAGEVWSSPMGASFVHGRLSRTRFYAATRWDAALPRQSSALSTRAPTRTRWLHSNLVCCAHRLLSLLSLAFTVSRKRLQRETSARECGALATFS